MALLPAVQKTERVKMEWVKMTGTKANDSLVGRDGLASRRPKNQQRKIGMKKMAGTRANPPYKMLDAARRGMRPPMKDGDDGDAAAEGWFRGTFSVGGRRHGWFACPAISVNGRRRGG